MGFFFGTGAFPRTKSQLPRPGAASLPGLTPAGVTGEDTQVETPKGAPPSEKGRRFADGRCRQRWAQPGRPQGCEVSRGEPVGGGVGFKRGPPGLPPHTRPPG